MTNGNMLNEGLSLNVICDHVVASFAHAARYASPYTYWNATNVLPDPLPAAICNLPFTAPRLGGISGKREKHNATRTYFDTENRAAYGFVNATAKAFQRPDMTRAIETLFDTNLAGSYLRMEYAQDVDGFWLEPHSDLGVKLFTLLLYLSDDPRHSGLGTDIYDAKKKHVSTAPFLSNAAMIFIPSDVTFHGFERRPITGVRKSLIINYVTEEWRAREQLAFPEAPVAR